MPDFDEFLDVLKDEIVDLAKTHLEEARGLAVQDAEAFLDESKDDLKRWTHLMEAGTLSEADVKSLVRGKKDVAEMKALKQAGLAAVEIDRFRNALLDRVVGTARDFFL